MVKSFEECKVFLSKKPVLFHTKDDDTMYVDMQVDFIQQQLKQATYKKVKCKDGKTIHWYEATIKKYTVAFDIHDMMQNSEAAVDAHTNMFIEPEAKTIWEDRFQGFIKNSAYMICFPTEQAHFFDNYQDELEEKGCLPQFVFVRRYTKAGKKGRRIVKINMIYPKKKEHLPESRAEEKKELCKKYEKKYNKEQLYKLVSDHEIKVAKSSTKAKMADALVEKFGSLYLH